MRAVWEFKGRQQSGANHFQPYLTNAQVSHHPCTCPMQQTTNASRASQVLSGYQRQCNQPSFVMRMQPFSPVKSDLVLVYGCADRFVHQVTC